MKETDCRCKLDKGFGCDYLVNLRSVPRAQLKSKEFFELGLQAIRAIRRKQTELW
jgi:hypothetical protein